MSYSQIIGHELIKEKLKEAIRTDRVSHGYIFYGIEGIGKLRFAREFARALQCLEKEGEPCGKCSSCIKASHDNHPDIAVYHLPEDRMSIPIDTIRDIQRELSYSPLEGDYKVCIIDEVHRLTKEAANAFLKTLEEPNPSVVLILITPTLNSLLPTIVSRCQRLKFPPLPPEAIEAHLIEEGVEAPRASLYATSSLGSLRRALDLAEEDWAAQRDAALDILLSLPRRDGPEIAAKIQELLGESSLDQRRKGLVQLFELFNSLLRDILLYSQGEEIPLMHGDRREDLSEVAHLPFPHLLEMMEKTSDYKQQVERNITPDLLVDQFALDLKEWLGS